MRRSHRATPRCRMRATVLLDHRKCRGARPRREQSRVNIPSSSCPKEETLQMRGHVRKPGSVWCFVIDPPRGGTGARRRRWCRGFTTKKQAQTAASALSDLGRGVYVEPSAMTVSDFLQRWLELCGKD